TRASELQSLVTTALGEHGRITVASRSMSADDTLPHLDASALVVADLATILLTGVQTQALHEFVRRGGALIALGEMAPGWQDNRRLHELLGIGPAVAHSPVTELVIQVASDHDITRRLDPTCHATGSCALLDAAPDGAAVLFTTSWRYATVPLAWMRPYGKGMVYFDSFTAAEGEHEPEPLRQALFRAIRYATGWREGPPIRVAMIGYGAIGFEHGSAMQATPGLDYTLVCDRNPSRLAVARDAFPHIRTTTEIADVLADDAIDAAIVAAPPNTHAALARDLLLAGKHVVVEKPFCLTTTEADDLISLANERNLTLTVYQNRRWDPDFLAIAQVVREGRLGDLFHVEMFIGDYHHPCDFWHSHEPISGGVFYDWGSHYLDWALTLLPDKIADVRASTQKRVWLDVTNADQATLHIRFQNGCEVIFIHSDVAALLKPKWYALGTKGALVANWRHETVTSRKWSGDLIEERLAPSEALPIVTLATRIAEGRINEEQLALPPAPLQPFHRNLANHLLASEPLAVSPTSSRRNIAVMEAAAYSAAHNSVVVPIDERYA
ncbi:MAG: Gfo/Idh/MocA family oxidoreductase, partial [Ktedonobacterales bacterium]